MAPPGAARVAGDTDREISDTVPIEVSGRGQRHAEEVERVERDAESTRRRADLLLGLHAADFVEEEHPHGTREGRAVGISRGTHGEVADAVAVEVADRRQRSAEGVVRVERAPEPAGERADLPRVLERAIGREGPCRRCQRDHEKHREHHPP
jgi:hypothetical protein